MRRQNQFFRSLALACIGTAALAGVAFAGPHGGGMSSFSGAASSHMSAQGLANSNSAASADRDFGRDRAADRTGVNASATTSNGRHATDRDFGRDRAADRAHRHHHHHRHH